MKSASMGKKFIPSSRRDNSRSRTPCSRPFALNCDGLKSKPPPAPNFCGNLRFTIYDLRNGRQRESLAFFPDCLGKHPTPNTQHPTSNPSHATTWELDVGCWMLDVPGISTNRKSQIVNRKFPRRVMGAWWPSRSSKPLLARFTGRGVFDSLPLRQKKGRRQNEECRKGFGMTQFLFRQILHSEFFLLPFPKGGEPHVPRTNS